MQLAQRKLGWIGVDVGTSTVNIAQVARSKRGWRVATSAVVPRHESWSLAVADGAEACSSLDELQAARSLQGYQGRSVVAALSMSLCDIHRIDRDISREPNAEQVLRRAIEMAIQQSSNHLQCDFWSAPADDPQPAWTQALTVSQAWTDRLCADIAQVGWNCEAIDGLPQAITRAVNMVHPTGSTEPIAALDWGNGRATLCLIEAGVPTYVRCLKNCGLRSMIDALVEGLQITELEAQRLLEDYGVAQIDAESNSTASNIAHLVQEVISESLHQLTEEIERSISHFQYLRRTSNPKQLYLMGGGAMIRDLDKHLSRQLNIDAKNWQLSTLGSDTETTEHRADCLLASAIALSALAWEVS